MKSQKKIVIAGGPSTGKSSLVSELTRMGYRCKEEVSREIIREGKKRGIDHFFLTHPIEFSTKLLTRRVFDFEKAEKSGEKIIFFDRGLPEIIGYLECFGLTAPDEFVQKCKMHRYSNPVFITPVWKEIYKVDDERYESYEEAKRIDRFLRNTYLRFNYKLVDTPLTSIEKRAKFILETLKEI